METIAKALKGLWRHRLVRVGLAYAATGWLIFQVVLNVSQALTLPAWAPKLTLVMLFLGFLPALIIAWAWRSPQPAADDPPPGLRSRAAPRGERSSIAVLPFANFSKKADDEVFADGIVEDLITSLSMDTALKVISRSSTFAYKNASPDVREVGRDLGAAFVLEGSVRRIGDRLRLTAQLIETETGGHIWTEQYDRPVGELFDMQDDLVAGIAAALGAEIDRADVAHARRTNSVSAWEEAMRSTIVYERPRLSQLPIAIGHARKAVALDSNFAMGHARLALALSTASQMKGEPPGGPMRTEAVEHIRRAVSLAPNDPRILGMATTGLAHVGFPEEGLRHGLRALELNPNDATLYGSVANALFRAGRAEEAFPYYDEEERLAPRSIWLNARYVYRALAYLSLEKLDEAAPYFRRAVDGDPAFEQGWVGLAGVLAAQGRDEEAREAIERLRELNAEAPLSLWSASLANAIPGPLKPVVVAGFERVWRAAGGPVE